MRALNVFLSILVSLALGILVLEGGLRLIGKGPTVTPLHFDEATGWSKRPGFKQVKKHPEFRAHFELNEYGLRDDPMASTAKPDGVYRILALGDSFTYGYSVDREDLFVDILERRLRDEGRNVEVINVGTEAWDTAQQAAWLEEHGAKWQPDLVLVFAYENDLYWNSQSEYQTPDGAIDKPRYLRDGTREATAIDPRKWDKPWHQSWAVTKWMAKPDIAGMLAHRFQPPGASRPIEKELAPLLATAPGFMGAVEEHTLGALRALRREADDLGAKILVAPLPPATLYEDAWKKIYIEGRGLAGLDWSGDRGLALFERLSEQAGIATIDARPALNAARAAGEPIYYSQDWHFNPLGNAAFAGFLQESLTQRADDLGLPAAAGDEPLPPLYEPEAELPFWLKLYLALFLALTLLYYSTYKDEPKWQPPLKVGALLAVVFATFMAIMQLPAILPPAFGRYVIPAFAVLVIGFVIYKLGNRITTITELLVSFIRRGHWYLMPLVVILLSIGSLLVVAASSPFVAPFIYTLF